MSWLYECLFSFSLGLPPPPNPPQLIPPSPSLSVSTCLFSTSASLFLSCKQVHLYHKLSDIFICLVHYCGASTVHAALLTIGSEYIYVGCANEGRHKKMKCIMPSDERTGNLTSDVYTHWGHIDTTPQWHTLSPPDYSATPHV